MPNHIVNRITIIGTPEQVQKVKEFVAGVPYEDGTPRPVDFNKIVPMPAIFDEIGTVASHIVDFAKRTANGINPSPLSGWNNRPLRKTEKDQHELCVRALKETGYAYWYDWAIDNWGTKWNAYAQDTRISENVLQFETAWCGVPDLISKLAEQFPDVVFDYYWSDEDTGNNVGHFRYEGGIILTEEIKNGSLRAYEIAFTHRPDRREWYVRVGNKYVPTED